MEKETLSREAFEEASYFVLHSARGLERNIYKYRFEDGNIGPILVELHHYQNPDGGFGHGLEPDLRSPVSSPIATTRAFQRLNKLDPEKIKGDLVKAGIDYFQKTFNSEVNRWFATPSEINDYPHAPWWHYNEEKGGTIIDESWGNPTAEILGYLLRFDQFVDRIDTEKLLNRAVERLNKNGDLSSEHEVQCYVKLYRYLPSAWSSKVRDRLVQAVQQFVRTDPSEWDDYVPKPIDFVNSPDSFNFGISTHLIEENLDFLIEMLENNGVIEPNWEWGQYEEEWDRAKKEWTGILTLRGLTLLNEFGRIRA